MALIDRIIDIRRLVCPRTSYVTAGSASKHLFIFGIGEETNSIGELFRENVEFENVELFPAEELSNSTLADRVVGHTLVLNNPCESRHVYSLAQLVMAKKTGLAFVVGNKSALSEVYTNLKTNHSKDCVVLLETIQLRTLLTIHKVISSSHSDSQTRIHTLGFNNQPSVQTRQQFKFLWENDQHMDGKKRVVQRLSDRHVDRADRSEQISKQVWDELVRGWLRHGMDDYRIYSEIRRIYLGSSLDEDLALYSPASAAEPAPPAKDEPHVDSHPKGREDLMTKLICECLPDELQNTVRSLLDYGCAEGAITARLCEKLNIPMEGRFGADVRDIHSEGFNFIQLSAEPDTPPEPRTILPRLRDGSIDLVCASMVFHHVKHITAILQELRRVLSPRGVLIIREHNCESASDGAFLDISHGLYSLSWSKPVEWPAFIDEYTAQYRRKGEWDDVIQRAGFVRIRGNAKSDGQYNSTSRLKLGTSGSPNDYSFSNVIKSYYAVYRPVHHSSHTVKELHRSTLDSAKLSQIVSGPASLSSSSTSSSSSSSMTSSSSSSSRFESEMPFSHSHVYPSRDLYPSNRSDYVGGESSMPSKRSRPEPILKSENKLFESSSHPGCYYTRDEGGHTTWISVHKIIRPEANGGHPCDLGTFVDPLSQEERVVHEIHFCDGTTAKRT